MKRISLIILFLALSLPLITATHTIQVSYCTFISKALAIIVLGDEEFVNASERCYNLVSQWGCYEILYLSANVSITPRANLTATKANFTWALTNWLKNKATSDTQVWIWIFSHGGGLHHQPPQYGVNEEWRVEDGRVETNSDEGAEINETLIGGSNRWVGIDECIFLYPAGGKETVWDDEFKQWLVGITYRRMVLFLSTCRNPESLGNETCYGGGFIDDLSAPRRIIITPTNETYFSVYNLTTGIGYFEEPFMNALDSSNPAWNEACNLIDADGIPSVLEAYLYAREHDMARKAVRNPSGNPDNDPWRNIYPRYRILDESPWLDDGGNFLPTFKNGADVGVGSYGYDSQDSQLARYTWHHPNAYSGCVEDINDDGKVDMEDMFIAYKTFGCDYSLHIWNSEASLADVNQDNKVDMVDIYLISKKYGWIG